MAGVLTDKQQQALRQLQPNAEDFKAVANIFRESPEGLIPFYGLIDQLQKLQKGAQLIEQSNKPEGQNGRTLR